MATYSFVPGLVEKIPHRLMLTGTPVLNRPVEMFTLLRALKPAEYDNFFRYAKRYCGAEQTGYGWDFGGATNQAELRERLKDVMIRREKDQVLTDLPAKRRVTVDVELSNQKEYDRAEFGGRRALKAAIKTHDHAAALTLLNDLRKLAGEGKVKTALEWLENMLEGGGSVIVFAHHKHILDALEAGLAELGVRTVRVDGDVPVVARQQAVDDFQAGLARVFLGTPGAAGVGLTLTKAQDVLFVEREWTPSEEEQAEDRAHRIGQTGSVTAWYLNAAGTVDEHFEALVSAKRRVIKNLMAGVDEEEDDGELFWAMANAVAMGDDR